MAKRTLSATVIDGCTAETRQRHHRIRIEKLHKTSTRTVDCELFWLQNCYLRYFVGLIQRRPKVRHLEFANAPTRSGAFGGGVLYRPGLRPGLQIMLQDKNDETTNN